MALKFDKYGFAITGGNIRVFYFKAETKEYAGWSDEFIYPGVTMPGNSTAIDPGEEVAGKVAVFTGAGWEHKEDHRGKTVYSTTDGNPRLVDYIGEIPEGFVFDAPLTPYDTWNGTKWVTDKEAQVKAQIAEADALKQQLIAEATVAITPYQDAVELGIATEQEQAMYTAWKTYRVLLNRVDTSTAPNITWPEKPE
ncbi:TPA: tail fiber assembly protein [Enterobacter asburiae]|nr:tail fiber assembly protein [Enterobacter asburiae]